jgi:hypothetical protein
MVFKFKDYFIKEARTFSDEKFDWITSKAAEWIWDEMQNANFFKKLKNNQSFRDFENSIEFSFSAEDSNPTTELQRAMLAKTKLNNLGGFLNVLPKNVSNEFVKFLVDNSETIKFKISRFGKSETLGKRGRKPGSKNKPKETKQKDPEISNEEIRILEAEIRALMVNIDRNKEKIKALEKGVKRKQEEMNELSNEIKKHSLYISECNQKIEKKEQELKKILY